MRILCVTPNVSIDRTLTVPGFAAGGVWRAERVSIACAGKGVNVARALGALGLRATCAGLIGGHTGRLAADAAAADGLDAAWSWRAGETRTCVIIVGGGGETTVVNDAGTPVTAGDWAGFEADVAAAAAGTDAVCISGSLPPDVPPGGLARLIAASGAGRRPVWVDTSGAWLADAVEAGANGIKVNGDEAGALLGHEIADADGAVAAAEELCRRGAGAAALTLGEASAVPVTSAVGSGEMPFSPVWSVASPALWRRPTPCAGAPPPGPPTR